MSVVYLARHEVIERDSAIKILRRDLAGLPDHRERFLREARAVNRVRHDNIVEVTDCGDFDGTVFLVMDYVPGPSLGEAIAQRSFDAQKSARVGRQIASALARAHAVGVVHRDLKPDNILMVSNREGREVIKITDFGIAKVHGLPHLTAADELFGTPGYIAPEYLAAEPADERADLYSLGAVMYEMLTGSAPFAGASQYEILVKPLTDSPAPPSSRALGVGMQLDTLVMRLLARAPSARPPSAHHVAVELDSILGAAPGGRAVLDRDSDPGEAISSGERKRRVVVPTLAIPSSGREPDPSATDPHAVLDRLRGTLEKMAAEIREREASGDGAPLDAVRASREAQELMAMAKRAREHAADVQAKIDTLSERMRERALTLGQAIEALSWDLAHVGSDFQASPLAESVPGPEVAEQLRAQADRAQANDARRDDLRSQLEALESRLRHDHARSRADMALLEAELEGTLIAARQLGHEIVHALDRAAAALAARRAPAHA